jgi:hypothetical protein
MCVGQKQIVDLRRLEPKITCILFICVSRALEHSAIDQNAQSTCFKQMAGASYIVGGTME